MKIELHPEAKLNFDQKANKLLGLVTRSEKQSNPSSFFSKYHPSYVLTPEQITGPVRLTQSDGESSFKGIVFSANNIDYEISETNFKELKKLSEGLYSIKSIYERVSLDFLERVIIEWIEKKLSDSDWETCFTEYLVEKTSDEVKDYVAWIPIGNLKIEFSFRFGNSVIKEIDAELIEKWIQDQEKLIPGHPGIDKLQENLKKKYQGHTAVVLKKQGEHEKVFSDAIDEARKFLDIVGIYSLAGLSPRMSSGAYIKGSQFTEGAHMISFDERGSLGLKSTLLNIESRVFIEINSTIYKHFWEYGFGIISRILSKESLTKFEAKVLNFTFLYSKVGSTADPIEKIVYALSALESILLKNGDESIIQNLSERLAFSIAEGIEMRREVIRNVRNIYGIRSRYIHHGQKKEELKDIQTFLFYMRTFHKNILIHTSEYTSKETFINALDDMKFA